MSRQSRKDNSKPLSFQDKIWEAYHKLDTYGVTGLYAYFLMFKGIIETERGLPLTKQERDSLLERMQNAKSVEEIMETLVCFIQTE